MVTIWAILMDWWKTQGVSIIELMLGDTSKYNSMKTFTLHFGINHYNTSKPPFGYGREIQSLQSCHFDAMNNNRLFGNIGDVFIDHEATSIKFKEKVLRLAELASDGDLVIITQSSHGTHHHDTSGDETDKEDEGTCFADKVMWDDEIKFLLSHFKEGVYLLTIWDTCHSGTATRLFASIPEGYLAKDAVFSFEEIKHFFARSKRYDSSIKCNHLHIGAAQDREYSLDGERNGNFTGRFLDTIERRYNEWLDCSIGKVMEEVLGTIEYQHPNIDIVTKGGKKILDFDPFKTKER